jgi:hypothetical protein
MAAYTADKPNAPSSVIPIPALVFRPKTPMNGLVTLTADRFSVSVWPLFRRKRDNKSNSNDSRIEAKFIHSHREGVDVVKFQRPDRRFAFHRLKTDEKTSWPLYRVRPNNDMWSSSTDQYALAFVSLSLRRTKYSSTNPSRVEILGANSMRRMSCLGSLVGMLTIFGCHNWWECLFGVLIGPSWFDRWP